MLSEKDIVNRKAYAQYLWYTEEAEELRSKNCKVDNAYEKAQHKTRQANKFYMIAIGLEPLRQPSFKRKRKKRRRRRKRRRRKAELSDEPPDMVTVSSGSDSSSESDSDSESEYEPSAESNPADEASVLSG